MRYSIVSNESDISFKINEIGCSDDVAVTRFGPGRRNLFIIHYVLNGKGYYNGKPVSKGQGFLIYPGQAEEYYSDKKEPWEFLWIVSSSQEMETVFKKYNANENFIFEYNNISEIKKISSDIVSKKRAITDSYKMLEIFLRIFNGHMSGEENINHKPSSEIYLNFVVKYIENNIYKNITINEITELLGVSQPYLYKIFTKKFNMSPKQYIIESKISYAKKLLKTTDMSVTQIANSVGYNDILTFSRFFSLRENLSPTEYRLKSDCKKSL